MVPVCRVTAGRQVSKDGLKLIAEISEARSWPSYLFLDSVTCHNLPHPSTLAYSMQGSFHHEATKYLNVDQKCEISSERMENWPQKSHYDDSTNHMEML